MVKQHSSEWKYPPRIHEPVALVRGNRKDCLKYEAVYESPLKPNSGERQSYALMSKIQLRTIDCIYNSLHELCIERQVRVGTGVLSITTPPNTLTFADASLYTPHQTCRPISVSEQRPLFTDALIRIEYVGDRIGTLFYEEDEQVLTKTPDGRYIESINFYLAFKLGNIKNITIQRK